MNSKLDKKILVRLPSDLHRKAKIKAVIIDKPVAVAVREFLEQWVKDIPLLIEEEETAKK